MKFTNAHGTIGTGMLLGKQTFFPDASLGGGLKDYAFYTSPAFKDLISGQPMQTTLDAGRPLPDNSGNVAGLNEPVLGENGIYSYGPYTNLVKWSENITNWTGSDPWTQVINLGTGTFTIATFLQGATLSITAGTATIDAAVNASFGSPGTFTVTAAGTITVTTDIANPKAQLTESPYVLPYIKTEDSQVSVPINYSDDNGGYKWPIGYADPPLDSDNWEEVDGVELFISPEISNGWTANGDGSYTFDGTSGDYMGVIVRDITLPPSTKLKVTIKITDLTIGRCYVLLGGERVGPGSYYFTTNGTETYIELMGGSDNNFQLSERDGFNGTVLLSIKQVQPSAAWKSCGQNLLDTLDGKADGGLENSGSLVSTNRYQIITTETDHFGTGVVAGDRITGQTTALDANNTVKQISPAQGEMQVEWVSKFGNETTFDHHDQNILSSAFKLVAYSDDSGSGKLRIKTYDGTRVLYSSLEVIPGTKYTINVVWGIHPTEGANKMQLFVTDGTTNWESSVKDFDGSFNPTDFLSIGWSNTYYQAIKSIKFYKEPKHWS